MKVIRLNESDIKKLVGKILKEDIGDERMRNKYGDPNKKVSYDVMVQKLRNGKMLGDWNLIDEVIRDLNNYMDKPDSEY